MARITHLAKKRENGTSGKKKGEWQWHNWQKKREWHTWRSIWKLKLHSFPNKLASELAWFCLWIELQYWGCHGILEGAFAKDQ
ncbi:hypothetical protein RHGRI_008135 [Rhododendron griersonianum]|uniref:Uncharacterized protein n=1 Tax=Rhododendron griersonianum TaxID=479676 RepID=A0AAV6JDN1_9ERIC|nr:hypothetical protein RHGRI_019151 [Rhododendron griersonianum]KAG5558114.1 hypothetical protein RHGRI_008135 [Rhododendron griersonianum]